MRELWKNRSALIALGLFVVSLAVRLGFIFEGQGIPVIRHPTPGLDINVYWNAARVLRGAVESGPNLELMICSAPLHVFVLAGLQAVLGESLLACQIFLAVVSSLRFLLLFYLSWQLCRKTWIAAVVTGMASLLPTLVYVDSVLLKASTDITLITLLLFVLLRPFPSRPSRQALGGAVVGVLTSLAFLNQLSSAAYIAVVVAFLLARKGPSLSQRLIYLAPALAIFVVTFTTFHLHLKGNLIPHSGVNILIGYHDEAGITYGELPAIPPYPHGHAFLSRLSAEAELGRPLTPNEANRYYLKKALDFIRNNRGKALRITGSRMLASINNYEIKGIDSIYWLQTKSTVLRFCPSRFGLCFVCGMIGLAALLVTRRFDTAILLGGMMMAIVAVTSISFVVFRFRLPMVIPCVLLGACGLSFAVESIRSFRQGSRWRYVLLVVVTVAAYALTARPVHDHTMIGLERRAAGNNRKSARLERATAFYDRVRADPEPSAELQAGAVRALYDLARHSEAYALARRILSVRPDDVTAQRAVYRYSLWLGDYDQARDVWNRMSPAARDELESHLHRHELAVSRLFIAK